MFRGYDVVGIDNLLQSHGSNLTEFAARPRFSFHRADVRDLVRGVGAIVHLAAYKIPRYGDRLETLDENSRGTASVELLANPNGGVNLAVQPGDITRPHDA